ncbi:molybdenum ABC transporter ATP-binding protein [Massilia sp. KIM]|uniref:molybdenum ABC transporter ATP-binding protein n=1 Tax=Massilia sp. KIM TaxID=1955422 RepID=UPI00098F9159|nr:molybdenum ABC transporter ATP-binding protein [Massilia sp. KIM]OON62117.1 molybdenum ABC transporter ATP-binding protein [Massilia sp. KIM]
MSIRARFAIDRGGFRLEADLTLPASGVSALFGHSGSGKTTLLRAIAGLERAPGGYMALGDEVWQDEARGLFVPTWQRAVGMVFQEPSLFPHLSVRGNLEFGRKRARRLDRRAPQRQPELDTIAGLLGIGHLLGQDPASLSGGERQRVAIARTLVAAPRLLLMDEPLAALDLRRKLEILPYLERLHDELSLPIVYVSHAADEVARLADHLVLLDGGRVSASGPLAELLARIDLAGAFEDDAGVVVDAVLEGLDEDGMSRLAFPGGTLIAARRADATGAPGARMRCRIQARDVSLALERPRHSSIVNILPAEVSETAPAGPSGQVLVKLQCGGIALLARISERSRRELGIVPGARVWAQVKAVALLA